MVNAPQSDEPLPDDPEARALYVHIPFCVRRCTYCDFPTGLYDESLADRYLEALARELGRLPHLQPRTLFIGGGTPTSLSPNQLERLFGLLWARISRSSVEEVTVEANPGTVTPEIAQLIRHLGANRVSLGAQTFHPSHSQLLGRAHEVSAIERAYGTLRDAGFKSLNLDIIYAVPGQTRADLDADIDRLLALGPEHVSCYALIYERGTEITRRLEEGTLRPAAEEDEIWMYDRLVARLVARGFVQYEIANFALPGFECRHNLVYWSNEPYYGIGVGAHSFIRGVRFANDRGIGPYLRRIEDTGRAVTLVDRLDPERRAREALMLRLRTRRGVARTPFARETGYDPFVLAGDEIERFRCHDLIETSGEEIRLTQSGIKLSDTVFAAIIA